MPLTFRIALPSDYQKLEDMVIESFGPITWARKVDEKYGPLDGKDWRQRWKMRFANVFATQIVLVGEKDREIVAMASGTIDSATRLAYIDLLAVDRRHQHRGYGREMLRGMLRCLRQRGAVHAHLECLADNDAGNNLYRSEGFEEVARCIRWFIKIPEDQPSR